MKSIVQEKADINDFNDDELVSDDALVDVNGEEGVINNGDSETFECDVCNKCFTTSLKLYYHKRNHRLVVENTNFEEKKFVVETFIFTIFDA